VSSFMREAKKHKENVQRRIEEVRIRVLITTRVFDLIK